jgi:ABC-2 type transport system ATP-binding protein
MHHIEQFCESLSLLRNGRVVLAGNIQQIKEDFQQKNIFIRANIDIEFVRQLEGVLSVIEHSDMIEVKIENANHVANVFEAVKLAQDVKMFDVRMPSLHEVFVAKVGEVYEEE